MTMPASSAEPAAFLNSARRDRLDVMAFPPFEELYAFVDADLASAGARGSRRASFGFTCHKRHVSLKELASGDSEMAVTPEKIDIKLNINGHDYAARVEPRKTLVDVIRDECGLTGTHIGCEHGVCGACTVILDDEAVRSCPMFAGPTPGKRLRPVEGPGEGGQPHPPQSRFI